METIPKDVERFLNRIGINAKRIRFGGVVGKIALIAVSAVAALALIALRTGDVRVSQACIWGVGVIFFVSVVAIFVHGLRHPLEATLEGTEVIAFQQVQQYAKGVGELPPSPPILVGMGTQPSLPVGQNQGGSK